MKAVKLNKKLWTEATMEDLDVATPCCTSPLIVMCGGCGCGCCSGGCCCGFLCRPLIC